jgi:hypothetical protein
VCMCRSASPINTPFLACVVETSEKVSMPDVIFLLVYPALVMNRSRNCDSIVNESTRLPGGWWGEEQGGEE